MSIISYSLQSGGGTEHTRFSDCFDVVVSDESASPRQRDVLSILESWRKVVAIDEDELVN